MPTRRYGNERFTFATDAGFETKFMHSGPIKAVVAAKTSELAGEMVKAAPRGPHVTTDEFSIKKNITPYVEEVGDEWVGYIVIEENGRARHAMLQEEGYRDPAGHRHEGRFFLKGVLEKERTD
ncbi:hypothetical protein ACWDBD_38900 [Streptomyces sp. NPDC001118]|uniref:hypothetical protein n=1 Tax=Streptomyces sp. NPDC001127 TaxID=3154377 RepID=UPI0033206E29